MAEEPGRCTEFHAQRSAVCGGMDLAPTRCLRPVEDRKIAFDLLAAEHFFKTLARCLAQVPSSLGRSMNRPGF